MDAEAVGELLAIKVLAVSTLALLVEKHPDPKALLDELESKIVGDIGHASIPGASAAQRSDVIRKAVEATRTMFGAITVTSGG